MLIGARDPQSMTAAQRQAYDVIASGPRKDVPLPFLAMLDVPELADAIQNVGARIRFSGGLDPRLREVAILATAAAFGSGYEWDYHEPIGRSLGLDAAEIAAIRSGGRCGRPAEDAIVAVCRAAVRERRIPEEQLLTLVGLIGRGAASEVVAIAGYYQMLALFLSAGALDHPLPST
ncbi:MAG: carboxymuconolactone decarboxylase family protein [Aestuariivirga sp.]|nr:carboxymuconolactone decarboxylase family protein [Aestuariivirga sp.]